MKIYSYDETDFTHNGYFCPWLYENNGDNFYGLSVSGDNIYDFSGFQGFYADLYNFPYLYLIDKCQPP